jgi:hypothetical protein
MGEAAEMMLDGTCCSSCGEYLGGNEGYPVQCASCRHDDKYAPRVPRFNRYAIKDAPKPPPTGDKLIVNGKMACPYCAKRVKVIGMGDHLLTRHRDKLEATP